MSTMRARYVQDAIPFMRSRMATRTPFPTSKHQLYSVLNGALVDSHHKHRATDDPEIPSDTDFVVTASEFTLLYNSIRLINEELQGLARELVRKHYGFQHPETTAHARVTASENQKTVMLLKSSTRFMFHGRQSNGRVSYLTSRQYLHPILEDFIFRAWFNQGSTSAGHRDRRRFDAGGIPLVTIAFVMSIIAAAVMEWQTGSFKAEDFLVHPHSVMRMNFHNSLSTLKSWEKHLRSHKPLTYSALRTLMLQNICARSDAAADGQQVR